VRIALQLQELTITGNEALKVLQALSSGTAFKILRLIAKEQLDVSTIARRLELSEAYVSEEVSRLSKLGLIKVSYAPGKRGIRKICELAVGKITILLIKP
jgi:predicted transcriptional regulator